MVREFGLEQNSQIGAQSVRAAEYVRMSTEHQKYSTENQAEAIRQYAARRGIEVVRTYADEGKSGLRLDGRDALKQLIDDVQRGIPGQLREIKALRNADGRIILFGINAAGHLYRNEQKVARALQPSDWTGWVQMDDPSTTGTFLLGTMAPSVDRAGAVNLFVINNTNSLLHARQAPPCTATWAGWSAPGIIRSPFRAVAAGIDGDAHLVVVATDVNLLQNMTMQLDVEAQQWSAWTAISPFSGSAPPRNALDYNADGRLSLFSHLPPASPQPNPGGLWLKSQMAFDSTEWEWAWTVLAADSIRQYAVVRDLTPPT